MKTQCWIDLFDLPTFRGERRRFFGPTVVDASVIGGDAAHAVSLRVGNEAALRIVMSDGDQTTLSGGEAIESLDAARVTRLEVKG